MLIKSKRLLIGLAAAVVLAAGLMLLREWRGPAAPGYRVEARPLVQTVVAAGRVVGVSRVQVGTEITGVVTERRVEEGDEVAAGDVLVVLRADDLAARVREAEAALTQLERSARPQSEVALREAQARLEQASRETERRRNLFERNLIAREAIEQAEETETLARTAVERARLEVAALAAGGSEEALLRERLAAARAALEKTVVRSEVAGVVLTRNAEPGDLVQPGRVLFEISRSGDTELLVPFDEENLAVLEIGQHATCVADAFPSQPFGAEIVLIAPRVDRQRGSVDVRLRISPVPNFLRQDMTVSVNVETGRRERAIVVPNDALLDVAGDRASVLAVRAGRVERVAVALGLRGLTLTEVVAGIEAGERVLVAGADIADGKRVRIVEQPLPIAAAPERAGDEPLLTAE